LRRKENRVMVVHCRLEILHLLAQISRMLFSAGIGRTGTFVAIHISVCLALCGIDPKKYIKDIVLHLRSQRMGMVQNPQQYNVSNFQFLFFPLLTLEYYKFIYAAVADVLEKQEKRGDKRKKMFRSLSTPPNKEKTKKNPHMRPKLQSTNTP